MRALKEFHQSVSQSMVIEYLLTHQAPAGYSALPSSLIVQWLGSSQPQQAAEACPILSFSMERQRGLSISRCEDTSTLRNKDAGGICFHSGGSQDPWKRKALFSLGIFSDARPVQNHSDRHGLISRQNCSHSG